MIVIGLTGSIGMGKSTAAKMLSDDMNIPVHDADAVAHKLMAPHGQAVEAIAALFPTAQQTDKNGQAYIDRKILGGLVLGDPPALKQLEGILHPLIRHDRRQFLIDMKKQGHEMVVLDLPLLFETGEDKKVNTTICVSAPAQVQKQRVLNRPNMTEEKFNALLKKQLPDQQKRHLSDIVVETDKGLDDTRQQLKLAIEQIRKTHKAIIPKPPKNGG